MITATTWVPRGFAAPFPTRYNVDDAEFDRISKLAKLQLEDAKEDLAEAQAESEGVNRLKDGVTVEKIAKTSEEAKVDHEYVQTSSRAQHWIPDHSRLTSCSEVDDDLKEYDLEHYDDVEENEGESMGMFGNVKSLAYHESNDEDPYITLKENDDEDEDREELQILATDNLVLAAKVEDEVAHLEVLVYEDEADNLYVHHDIMLPAIPLCVEWLDFPVGKDLGDDARGNYIAVGTFDPDIEIWDLDTVDQIYPNAILGQGGDEKNLASEEGKKKKKKRKKSNKANDDYHVDAVLSLGANRAHRNLLASASADKTVKLWDLNTGRCAKSYSYHTDKVCSLAWHPTTTTVLLSGSYDRTVVAGDMRAPDAKVPRWGVESDVESVRWDPHDPNYLYVSQSRRYNQHR